MGHIIDISHWHPVTDWKQAAKYCDVLICKATEGKTYIDPTLQSFIKGCEMHHIPYFLYSFVRRGNELEGTKFLLQTCKKLVGDYFVGYALDVETAGNGTRPTANGVKDALEYLCRKTDKVLLYTMYAQYSEYKSVIENRPGNCAWWEARYGLNNGKDTSDKYPCHAGVDLHQFTDAAILDFCQCSKSSGIDLNKIVSSSSKKLNWYTATGKTAAENSDIKLELPTLQAEAVLKIGGATMDFDEKKEVKKLQNCLNHILNTSLSVDGEYGTRTKNVVIKFQKNNKLNQDGVFGKKTLASMKESVRRISF